MNRFQRRIAESRAKKDWEKSMQPKLNRVLKNGAGLTADEQLREFFKEYNDRFLKHGPNSLPAMFVFLRDFFSQNHNTTDPPLSLYGESDHIASLIDFLDFATSKDISTITSVEGFGLEDSVIYNYTFSSRPGDFTVEGEAGVQFSPVASSLIRHGNLATIFTTAGIEPSELSKLAKDLEFDREFRDEWLNDSYQDQKGREPDKVGVGSSLSKCFATCRINLLDKTILNRGVAIDCGTHYNVFLDDPEPFENSMSSGEVEKYLETQSEKLEQYEALFDVCATAVYLPAYFGFKYTLIRDTTVPTAQAPKRYHMQSEEPVAEAKSFPKPDGVRFRRVQSLEIVDTGRKFTQKEYVPPSFKVIVGGFWRRLKDGSVGTGPDGKPVEGRTWIKPHTRWNDKPTKPKTVFVKSRLSNARDLIEKYENKQGKDESLSRMPSRSAMYIERTKLTKSLRYEILERDGFQCKTCGADAVAKEVTLHVDHIVPISKGGLTTPSNLQVLCSSCNLGKSDKY